MYSCAIRSSSSVVTPGATALPASSSACAAILPAIRIFSMVSAVCTQGSLPSFTVFFHAYSGRSIERGTSRVGESVPGTSGWRVRTDMDQEYPHRSARIVLARATNPRSIDGIVADHGPFRLVVDVETTHEQDS